MLRFSVFGFPVTVHWMFWVMTAVLGGALDAKSPQQWQGLLLWVVAAFASILIHELGHTFMQRRFGARAQILLYAFGGLAIPDRGFTRQQHIVVSLAGPAVQILLGFIAWEILNAMLPIRVSWKAIGWLSHGGMGEVPAHVVFVASMTLVSIFWGLFNLVPIMPMDGGHVLLRILGPQKEKTVWLVGLLCAAALALYMLLVWQSMWNTVLFGMLAWQNFQRMQGRTPPPFMRP
jgi:membrane-associated protease RseP (regulator of RpoE activity)